MRILTLGIKTIDRSQFKDIIKTYLNKPGKGCLYGSTEIKLQNGLVTSGWKRWTSLEDFGDYNYGLSYKLKRDAKILTIDSMEAYLEALKKYSCKAYEGARKDSLDFSKICKDYDAFHLTEDAFYKMRMIFTRHDIEDFYSYDSETWVVFNPDCINYGSVLSRGNVVTDW